MRINLEQLLEQDPLLRQALSGDAEAARQYCGCYQLIQNTKNKKLYRCQGTIPKEYTRVTSLYGQPVTDAQDFLLPKYWSLPRIIDGKER